MNKTKVILTALIGIIILSSCSAVKSGLSGRKENNTDEFLVKKNPHCLYHRSLKNYQYLAVRI